MKIVFFGLGSIGQRHAKILLKNYQFDLFAFRSGIRDEPNALGIKEIYSWDEIETLKPDVAFITNPTHLHIETAIRCAKVGCNLFIEKPIGKNLNELKQLINLVKRKNLVTYIAYNLRFHPVVKKIREYIGTNKPLHARIVCTSFYPLWRPNKNHLEIYSANSSLGGGVILDLSHEIDYVSYLLGNVKSINGNYGRRDSVTVDSEDFADILVETEMSPVNIHINFLSQFRQRIIQIDFENLTVIGDIFNVEIKEYKGEKLHKSVKLKYDKGQEYEEQISYFFKNINNPSMMNNLRNAENLFKKVIEFINRANG